MRFIKGMLLVLSLFQYLPESSFWQKDFYWFFLWIIAFQILWFYLENPRYRKRWLGLLAVLTFINAILLPELPMMMITLYVIDVREELSLKQTGIVLGGLLVLLSGAWTFLGAWPESSTLMFFMGFIGFGLFSTKQAAEIQKRNKRHYEYLLAQDALEEKTELLQSQMQSMEEVYTLNERNRISRDLHDSVGHTLSTIVIQLAAIEKMTEQKAPEASSMLNELHAFTKKGLKNVREVIHALKPSKYSHIAFIERIDHLVNEFGNNNHLQIFFNHNEPLWALNEEQEQMIFRAIQEFLVNTVKHSQADEVRILNHFTPSSLIVTMQDNGVGTDSIIPQMGLTGMKERAKLLGGKVHIQSSINSGFRIRIVLPKGGYADVER